ncbi:MAG: hypothetical protein HOH14_06845 [Gammaproteobacteria bacterium]|jgi:hypothetical protein|nr:hypothetical protein [Gammaproteobacteria bacterium]MBT6043193.1 hypothetical protein [Gammaproteobacteria bacterium]
MKIYAQDGSELMDVSAIQRDGNKLMVKGKIFQSMPMTARLTPEEARKGLKLMSFSTIIFLISFLFRSSSKKAGK